MKALQLQNKRDSGLYVVYLSSVHTVEKQLHAHFMFMGNIHMDFPLDQIVCDQIFIIQKAVWKIGGTHPTSLPVLTGTVYF